MDEPIRFSPPLALFQIAATTYDNTLIFPAELIPHPS